MQRNRTRDYYRKVRAKAITRKKRLDHELHWVNDPTGAWYKHAGCFSKGKIHCSCDMCNAKTRYNGYKPSDLIRFMRDKEKVDELSSEYSMDISRKLANIKSGIRTTIK